MADSMTRRILLKTAGVAAATGLASQALGATQETAGAEKILIVGISASPRKGKTTATSVQVALDAAKGVAPNIEVQLIDLGGMRLAGSNGGLKPGEGPQDDIASALAVLKSPNLGGLIIGSPAYFRGMSALCKAFLEDIAVLREPRTLADKPVGVLSVGSYRNGGQELTIEQIQTVMLCYEMAVVGGKPGAVQGATLWNNANDDIMKDEFGIDTAKKLGVRVAEAALRLKS